MFINCLAIVNADGGSGTVVVVVVVLVLLPQMIPYKELDFRVRSIFIQFYHRFYNTNISVDGDNRFYTVFHHPTMYWVMR